MPAPTQEAYAELQQAFDHFNTHLFDGMLMPPMFTMPREHRCFGFCSKQRFVSRSGILVDEMAMNPAYFAVRPIRATLSTLVHEMVHTWQFHYGTPGRRGYHNREWAAKMKAIGLQPSHTGQPGGKETGERMTHYIIDGGPFDQVCEALLTQAFTLSWMDRYPVRPPAILPMIDVSEPEGEGDGEEDDGCVAGQEPLLAIPGLILPLEKPENRSNRIKYRCDCGNQVWGKPALKLACMDHDQAQLMIAEED